MDNYNQEVRIQKVEDTSIGPGERFKKRMAEIMIATYIGVIILSFGIPLIFLDWFYKWKILHKLKLIKLIIFKLNYSGKWQYISGTVKNNHFHYGVMLALYFYIVSVALLLPYAIKIAKIIVSWQYNKIINTEVKYQDEIEKRKRKFND